ncbi:MAG TPA: HAMP domain-containing sensor histidine kinase [Burkholderiaceae bacterium]
MHAFLSNNRDELIARCKAKVAQRPRRAATAEQLANGVPLFLEQLTKTLEAELQGDVGKSLRISGASGGDATKLSEIGVSAAAHGKRLLELGFTVDQVVHDYGDLCQAITDLAVERDAPFSVDEFRTLNRCLDNAIADAVTEFSVQRDATVARRQSAEEHERLGVLVHELRNHLNTATLAFRALESGTLPVGGSTGGVLNRSLASLSTLLSQALTEVRLMVGTPAQTEAFSLAMFVADARNAASLYAEASGCSFAVPEVDPLIGVTGNRELLLAALVNLLQNAFKFTHPHTEVTLRAYADEDRVVVEVTDNCGGLPAGALEMMFKPFKQSGNNRNGLGLGLSIAKRSVEASGGTLRVRDVPGTGCVFTIDLPRQKPL